MCEGSSFQEPPVCRFGLGGLHPELAVVFLAPVRAVNQRGRTQVSAKQMRLKLVILASIIAAIVGAGSAIAIILFAFSSLESIRSPGVWVLLTYLLPLLTTLLASVFVYRHTARRRKLQAALTALIALLLTLALFLLGSILTARPQPLDPQPDVQRNAA
jgi:drug/metabolite transporter (DMT)-like permease